MRIANSRLTGLGAILAALLLLALPEASRASTETQRREPVRGSWVATVPCAPIKANLSTNQITCLGSTLWSGTWTGETAYTMVGVVDTVAATGHGTIDETFVGRDDRGRVGTLQFAERFTIVPSGVPATGRIDIQTRIIGGTGELAGMRGVVAFVGLVNLATGSGSFAGWWQPTASRRTGGGRDTRVRGSRHRRR